MDNGCDATTVIQTSLWNTSPQEKQTARFWTEGIFLRKHLCCNAHQSVITLIRFKCPYLWLMSCEAVRSVIDSHAPAGQAFKLPGFAVLHTAPEKYQNAGFHSNDFGGTNFSKALHMLSESCRSLRDLTSAHQNSWKMLSRLLCMTCTDAVVCECVCLIMPLALHLFTFPVCNSDSIRFR